MLDTLERADVSPIEAKKPGRPQQRRHLRRRACRALLAGIVLFALAQVAIRVTIEDFWPELRDPTFEIKYRQFARLKARCPQPPVTVVFFGSSMTALGMKADMVDTALSPSAGRPVIGFNMGTSNAGPLTHLMYLQRLLRRGDRPDLAVLEVTPMVYDWPEVPHDVARFPANALSRQDLDTIERYSREPGLRSEWWPSYLVPVHGHRLTILNQSAIIFVPFRDRLELWRDMDDHGWRRFEKTTPEKHPQVLAKVNQNFEPRLSKFQVGQPPVKALREVTGLLAKERITTIMVFMPEGPMFRSLYRQGSLSPLLDEVKALSRAHGFPLIEARTWFDEEMFTDSFHLNHEGAQALTQRLLRDSIAPALNARCAAR